MPRRDAAVEDDRHASAHGIGDARQLVDRGRHAVKRAPAVIGDIDGIDAALDGLGGGRRRHHALDHDGEPGLLLDPQHVVEIEIDLAAVHQLGRLYDVGLARRRVALAERHRDAEIVPDVVVARIGERRSRSSARSRCSRRPWRA